MWLQGLGAESVGQCPVLESPWETDVYWAFVCEGTGGPDGAGIAG